MKVVALAVVTRRFPVSLQPAQKIKLLVLTLPSSITWMLGTFVVLMAVSVTVPGLPGLAALVLVS